MNDASLLAVGTALVFIGLALASAVLLRTSSEATGVARSLLAIEQLHLDPRATGSQLPAGDRLLRPALARLARLCPPDPRELPPGCSDAGPRRQPGVMDGGALLAAKRRASSSVLCSAP